jgi:hypothetical protein
MDDGRSEILLGGIVGRGDVRVVEEDEQAGAVLAIARLEAAGVGRVGLLAEEGPEDEPVDGVLDQQPTSGERGRRERLAEVVEADGPAE